MYVTHSVLDYCVQVGCDRSSKLCSICQSRGNESLISDCLSLPLRTAAFDAVLCIAVVHHLSTEVTVLVSYNILIQFSSDVLQHQFEPKVVCNKMRTATAMCTYDSTLKAYIFHQRCDTVWQMLPGWFT